MARWKPSENATYLLLMGPQNRPRARPRWVSRGGLGHRATVAHHCTAGPESSRGCSYKRTACTLTVTNASHPYSYCTNFKLLRPLAFSVAISSRPSPSQLPARSRFIDAVTIMLVWMESMESIPSTLGVTITRLCTERESPLTSSCTRLARRAAPADMLEEP